jgi:osmotically-inducible protein OsmY
MQKLLKSDSEIHKQVLDELRWDTRIDETDVGVEVDKGTVTLTGTVDSYAKRLAAEEAAHSVSGVLDVANDIKVKLPGSLLRTDTDIAQAVRRALDWNVLLRAERVQTTVSEGWVTLSGEVDQLWERGAAERTVEHLTGVKGVTNMITVKPQPVRPEEVKRRIEEALSRRAEREAERLRVDVADDGVVTLSGRVQNWPEVQAILGSVRFAPGVRRVVDNLTISAGL